MRTITTILIISIAIGGFYLFQDSANAPVIEPEEIEELTSYQASEELNGRLEQALSDLETSLVRGDAELAPTYEEFIIAVAAARDLLTGALELYAEESYGQEVNEEMSEKFTKLKELESQLSAALMRGDAELAPSYEEFYQTISKLTSELKRTL